MKSAILVTIGCLALAACGGDESIKCSFNNPIVVDESAAQWPKFRRDSQNTGTITLPESAYNIVASGQTQRDQVWVFPPLDEPARGPFVSSASLSPGSGNERNVYIGSVDGTMFALRASDGAPVETELGEGVLFSVNPAAITSTAMVGTLDEIDAIVVGTGDTRVVAIDIEGFILRDIWPFVSDSFVRSSPAMTLDGLFLTASLGTGVFGVCPNGVGRFGVATGSTESSPALSRSTNNRREDGSFLLGSSDRRLRSIRDDGVISWTFAMSAPIIASPVVQLSASGDDTDAIYVADASGLVSKVDSSGAPVSDFGFERGSIGRTESSPALTQHPTASLRLYLGSDDGKVYAIDAQSGAVLWSFATGGFVRSSPAVVLNADAPSDPIVIIGSFDGSLYFIQDTGSEPVLLGTFSVPEGVASPNIPNSIESSPAVDRDGTVIFGADNGRLYAVR